MESQRKKNEEIHHPVPALHTSNERKNNEKNMRTYWVGYNADSFDLGLETDYRSPRRSASAVNRGSLKVGLPSGVSPQVTDTRCAEPRFPRAPLLSLFNLLTHLFI